MVLYLCHSVVTEGCIYIIHMYIQTDFKYMD